MKEMKKEYPYLYETHLHTSQGSACGQNSGYDMAKACHRAGYAGIIVTDHNWGGNTAVDRRLPWKEWVEQFAKGYEDAKRYADQHPDFDVYFGYEAGFRGTEFLIYGISPAWLKAHPEIREAGLEEHLRLVRRAGGTVVHAHPFREAGYIPETVLVPELVDAVEGVNATHSNHRSGGGVRACFDRKALEYAKEQRLPLSAGSDIHATWLLGGGVAFRQRLTGIEDFCDAIKSDEDRLLTNGDVWFDKHGNQLK